MWSADLLTVSVCPAATWVGGAFIVGTAEIVYTPSRGLISSLVMLFGFSLSFIIGKSDETLLALLFKCHIGKKNLGFHFDTKCDVLFVLNEGSLTFVKPMRERHFVTMLDPFHVKYGKALAAALSLVSVFIDVVWFPATLIGLGTFHYFVYLYPRM